MKRLIAGLCSIPILLLFIPATSSAQSVDNFTFDSFDADYYLSQDDEGRSHMRVVETLVAQFPDHDQNKGIVREIPITYDGHPLSYEFVSLTRNGQPEPVYDESKEGGFAIVETGTDEYVTGQQTYEFTYTLRDVTRDLENTQELFWNVNGTGWRQPFESVTARVHLDDSTKNAFTGKITCYQGRPGSRYNCESQIGESLVTFTTTRPMKSGETLSLVMEFEPDAFSAFAEGSAGLVRWIIAAISVFLTVAGTFLGIVVRRRSPDAPGRGTIIPEYTPLKHISPLYLASIYENNKMMSRAVTAQIMDLAVRKFVKIIETERKQHFFSSKPVFELELKKTKGLSDNELKFLSAFFGDILKPGARYNLSKAKPKTTKKLHRLKTKLDKQKIDDGYRYKAKNLWLPLVVLGIAFVSALGVFINMSEAGFVLLPHQEWRTIPLPLSVIAFIVMSIILGKNAKPLTNKGRKVVDYLKGVEMYVKLAEADRLRYLQSPEGALRTSVDAKDTGQVVKLYEKLLPYAVLLNQEKQWFKQIGDYYEQQQSAPAWYAGTSSFNAAHFSTAMSQVSSTATTSSGSGFSGGAGGGGGGGGGGGR
ncbi:MAG: DUF2207 domain-containing protein [Candidatus Saccharibacteria bacterium]|nr:DUF2207 domain-containing protein [Candidatus Saccharibacteria bacterium]